MTMLIFSILFVFFWMNIHIESFFIASVGMLQIVLSLPFARLFYSIIGQVAYFSTLQSLVIFLVLGIGADDVFVLVDGWRQSQVDVPRLPGEDDEALPHLRVRHLRHHLHHRQLLVRHHPPPARHHDPPQA